MIDKEWAEAHAAGKHQDEIVRVMRKIEPCLHGHPRAIIMFALLRTVAGMLGPARPETRKQVISEIPGMLHGILRKMDEMMEKARH